MYAIRASAGHRGMAQGQTRSGNGKTPNLSQLLELLESEASKR